MIEILRKNSYITKVLKSFVCLTPIIFFLMVANAAALEREAGPPKIISLYAAHTEILLRLGAKDLIIGVSGQETYQGPETEGWHPPVFSIRDDLEKYLAAKPDIVMVRPMHLASGSALVTALQKTGIKVYAAQVVDADGLYEYWREVGKLAGKEEAAETMIADFESALAPYHLAASQRQNRPGVFVEAMHGPIKTFTPDSLPGWLVELGGGRNVAYDAKAAAKGLIIADYGPERLLSKADEVDIFICQEGPMNRVALEVVKNRNIYQPIKAFKEGHVYQAPEEIIARPTPSLLSGLELIAGWTGLEIDSSPQPAILDQKQKQKQANDSN